MHGDAHDTLRKMHSIFYASCSHFHVARCSRQYIFLRRSVPCTSFVHSFDVLHIIDHKIRPSSLWSPRLLFPGSQFHYLLPIHSCSLRFTWPKHLNRPLSHLESMSSIPSLHLHIRHILVSCFPGWPVAVFPSNADGWLYYHLVNLSIDFC